MNIDKIFQSKVFQGIILGIAALVVILFIFKAGMIVGIKKADFSCRWSDNYHENFGGPRGGFWGGFNDKDFIESNGTVGQIIKIEDGTFIVRGREDVEKIIIVNDGTVIKRLMETIKITDLKIDDQVVIIGEPNDAGQIEAKLIRAMPPLPMPGPAPRGF
jgi:hypothetical protein